MDFVAEQMRKRDPHDPLLAAIAIIQEILRALANAAIVNRTIISLKYLGVPEAAE